MSRLFKTEEDIRKMRYVQNLPKQIEAMLDELKEVEQSDIKSHNSEWWIGFCKAKEIVNKYLSEVMF